MSKSCWKSRVVEHFGELEQENTIINNDCTEIIITNRGLFRRKFTATCQAKEIIALKMFFTSVLFCGFTTCVAVDELREHGGGGALTASWRWGSAKPPKSEAHT